MLSKGFIVPRLFGMHPLIKVPGAQVIIQIGRSAASLCASRGYRTVAKPISLPHHRPARCYGKAMISLVLGSPSVVGPPDKLLTKKLHSSFPMRIRTSPECFLGTLVACATKSSRVILVQQPESANPK